LKLKSDAAKKYKQLLDNIGHYHIQESGTEFLRVNGWNSIKSSIPSSVFSTGNGNYQMANEHIWKLLQGTAHIINIK
jgi:hypothetical protein